LLGSDGQLPRVLVQHAHAPGRAVGRDDALGGRGDVRDALDGVDAQ